MRTITLSIDPSDCTQPLAGRRHARDRYPVDQQGARCPRCRGALTVLQGSHGPLWALPVRWT